MKGTRVCLLLVALFTFMLVPFEGQGSSVPALQNGGFERWKNISTLDGGWEVQLNGAAMDAEASDLTENGAAARFLAGASQKAEATLKQSVTGLSPGVLYAFSIDFKMPEAFAAGYGFSVTLADSNANTIVKPETSISHSDREWMEITCLFIAPRDGILKITLSFLPDGKGKKSLLLDNTRLGMPEKGKMELYKNPLDYVLPSLVTSEAEAKQRLPSFYDGTVSLSGGARAQGSVLVRWTNDGSTSLAAIGSYSEENELLDFVVFRGEKEFEAASVSYQGTTKGFLWEMQSMVPHSNPGILTFEERKQPIIPCGGFESYVASTPLGWSAYRGWNGGYCFYDIGSGNGNYRMRITDSVGDAAPYVYRRVALAPETKYRFSVWCRQEDMTGSGAGVKLEFYNSDKVCVGELTEKFSQDKQSRMFEFQTPPGTAEAAVLLRIYTKGTAYFDNVSMQCISDPPVGSVITDEIFYYPEWESGILTVRANTVTYKNAIKGRYNLRISESGSVLYEKRGELLTDGKGRSVFPTFPMTKVGVPYEISAEICDEGGKTIGICKTTCYQYPRPTVLDKDGNYRNEDGSLFVPRLAYHVAGQPDALTETGIMAYQHAKDAGMNVIQLSTGCIYDPDITLAVLDVLHDMGLKALLPLYDKRQAAGSDYHKTRTAALVRKVRDHPAVFAYGIYDEPVVGTDGLTEEDLINSYRIIRDIDKKHPTYTVIAPSKSGSAAIAKPGLTKYTDVICYDPYPACWDDSPSSYVYEVDAAAKETVYHKRPVYSLLQVFDWRGFFPSADEYRHMWYQAAMAGAKGIGIYSFMDAMTSETGEASGLWTSDIWKDIVEFAKTEMPEAEKHFMYGIYPIFAEGETEDYRYRAWEKDEAIYMVILRIDSIKATSSEKAPTISTDILLDNHDVTKKIGTFTAECLYGGETNAVSGNGRLSVPLGHRQALVYKITAR